MHGVVREPRNDRGFGAESALRDHFGADVVGIEMDKEGEVLSVPDSKNKQEIRIWRGWDGQLPVDGDDESRFSKLMEAPFIRKLDTITISKLGHKI